MEMITLRKVGDDDFLIDTSEYPSHPSEMECCRIRMIESEIRSRSDDFLQDPEEYLCEWEELTGMNHVPFKYTNDLPEVLLVITFKRGSNLVNSTFSQKLPVMDSRGVLIHYPEERKVDPEFSKGIETYILDNKLYQKVMAKS